MLRLEALSYADLAVLALTVVAALAVFRLSSSILQSSFLYLAKLAIGIAVLRAAEGALASSTLGAGAAGWAERAQRIARAGLDAARAAI